MGMEIRTFFKKKLNRLGFFFLNSFSPVFILLNFNGEENRPSESGTVLRVGVCLQKRLKYGVVTER